MKMKILGILVCMLLIITAILPIASSIDSNQSRNRFDVVDQEQTKTDSWMDLSNENALAQSFKPTKGKLTRVQLKMSASSDLFERKIYVGIWESLVPKVVKSWGMFDCYAPKRPSTTWIDFDLDDVEVDIGQTYYIVAYDKDSTQENYYIWWFGSNTPYTDGQYWSNPYYHEEPKNWMGYPLSDFCFKTWGESIPNRPPRVPKTPWGPPVGQPGVVYTYYSETTDPDNDWLKYKWKFGNYETDYDDGELEKSGDTVQYQYSWDDEGTYLIMVRARDWHDLECLSWSDALQVTIPRTTPSGCLAGSQVSMYNGPPGYTKNIENIVVGDVVHSYDVINQQMVPAEVVDIHVYGYDSIGNYSIIDNSLTVSSNHAMYLNRSRTYGLGWFEVQDVVIGDLSLKKDSVENYCYWEEISSLSENPTQVGMQFYDLELLPYGAVASGYWANGILVYSV